MTLHPFLPVEICWMHNQFHLAQSSKRRVFIVVSLLLRRKTLD
jgi:hypothetical protein